jgi:hypothetical protein
MGGEISPGKKTPTAEEIWKKYESGLDFNRKINLDKTVEDNENFFIGKQWEGVKSNGLPTPVFNFLKRDVLFCVASNTSDNIKLSASMLPAAQGRAEKEFLVDVVNAQFDALFEQNKIPVRIREFMRNAAVDGDGAMYVYWDADVETGQDSKGAIRTEIIENTRVVFGNPNERRVQNQPWIILVRRLRVYDIKERARENGGETDGIAPDSDDTNSLFDSYTDDKATMLLFLRRDKETKNIFATEATRHAIVRKEWDLGITHYPLIWMNWDYVQDSYHGQAMITGLLNNQQFVNKMFAMVMVSQMHTAFPRTVYDKSRIRKWTNQIGAAIGIEGGDTKSVATILEPAQISPQVSQVISSVVDYTQSCLGATSAALGDTRPDNTSAIIALQRASSVPMELTKQNMYDAIEDLGLIFLDFMGAYYGQRYIDMTVDSVPPNMLPEEVRNFAQAGLAPDMTIPVPFDFAQLKNVPMQLKLDVGASSYWSEIASLQTLDNLLMQNKIDVVQYLERVPDGFIPKRQELIAELKSAQMAAQNPTPEQALQQPNKDGVTPAPLEDIDVVGGRGFGKLQRAINETGTT